MHKEHTNTPVNVKGNKHALEYRQLVIKVGVPLEHVLCMSTKTI